MPPKTTEFPQPRKKKGIFAHNLLLIGIALIAFVPRFPLANGKMPDGSQTFFVETGNTGPLNRENLHDTFIQGERALETGRNFEAVILFKNILATDSNDWDSRERLVEIYQALGLKEERDVQLGIMRRMYHSGRAWKPYICREQFLVGSKKVRVLEIPGMEAGGTRNLLFLVSESKSGKILDATTVRRLERRVLVSADSAKSGPRLFELVVLSRGRRKSIMVPDGKPDYSEMKRVFLESVQKK